MARDVEEGVKCTTFLLMSPPVRSLPSNPASRAREHPPKQPWIFLSEAFDFDQSPVRTGVPIILNSKFVLIASY